MSKILQRHDKIYTIINNDSLKLNGAKLVMLCVLRRNAFPGTQEAIKKHQRFGNYELLRFPQDCGSSVLGPKL